MFTCLGGLVSPADSVPCSHVDSTTAAQSRQAQNTFPRVSSPTRRDPIRCLAQRLCGRAGCPACKLALFCEDAWPRRSLITLLPCNSYILIGLREIGFVLHGGFVGWAVLTIHPAGRIGFVLRNRISPGCARHPSGRTNWLCFADQSSAATRPARRIGFVLRSRSLPASCSGKGGTPACPWVGGAVWIAGNWVCFAGSAHMSGMRRGSPASPYAACRRRAARPR